MVVVLVKQHAFEFVVELVVVDCVYMCLQSMVELLSPMFCLSVFMGRRMTFPWTRLSCRRPATTRRR